MSGRNVKEYPNLIILMDVMHDLLRSIKLSDVVRGEYSKYFLVFGDEKDKNHPDYLRFYRVYEIGKKYQVTVATSDSLEQMIISGEGGRLLSAKGLREEVEQVKKRITL